MVSSTVRADGPQGNVDAPASRVSYLGPLGSRQVRAELAALGGSAWDLAALPTPGDGTLDGPCRLPLVFWHSGDHRPFLLRCNGSRASRCRSCALRYARRVRRVAGTGALHVLRSGLHLAHVIVTGPGDPGHRRWSVHGPRGDRPVCGCEHTAEHGLGAWNRTAGRRWNHLLLLLRREWPDAQFFRGVEPQQRGALHLHLLLGTAKPVAAQRVQELVLAAGFGCNVRVDPITGQDAMRAAGYVSKYVTKDVTGPSGVPWDELDESTGELIASEPSYRRWSQSRRFGCTMREHVAAIRAQRVRQLDALEGEHDAAVELVASLLGALVLDVDPSPPD